MAEAGRTGQSGCGTISIHVTQAFPERGHDAIPQRHSHLILHRRGWGNCSVIGIPSTLPAYETSASEGNAKSQVERLRRRRHCQLIVGFASADRVDPNIRRSSDEVGWAEPRPAVWVGAGCWRSWPSCRRSSPLITETMNHRKQTARQGRICVSDEAPARPPDTQPMAPRTSAGTGHS